MKRFNFPLERVRQWRQTQLDLEHAKLQQLYQERRQLDLAVDRLVSGVAHAEQKVQVAAIEKQVLTSEQLANLDDYRLFAKREAQILARQQEELEVRITEQQKHLLEARRNYRLLDKLRGQALTEWEQNYNREVENLASELHLARWGRE